jgi:hypothetical protein
MHDPQAKTSTASLEETWKKSSEGVRRRRRNKNGKSSSTMSLSTHRLSTYLKLLLVALSSAVCLSISHAQYVSQTVVSAPNNGEARLLASATKHESQLLVSLSPLVESTLGNLLRFKHAVPKFAFHFSQQGCLLLEAEQQQ